MKLATTTDQLLAEALQIMRKRQAAGQADARMDALAEAITDHLSEVAARQARESLTGEDTT
jgi:hypothetical protein